MESVDEVLFVLPREFPHKEYSGASFVERIEMLRAAVADGPAFSWLPPIGDCSRRLRWSAVRRMAIYSSHDGFL